MGTTRAAAVDLDGAAARADGWDEHRHDHLGRVGFYKAVPAPGTALRLCRLHVQRQGTGLVAMAHEVNFEAPLDAREWTPARAEAERRLGRFLRAAADALDPPARRRAAGRAA